MRLFSELSGRFRRRAQTPVKLTYAYYANNTTYLPFCQFTQFLLRKLIKPQA